MDFVIITALIIIVGIIAWDRLFRSRDENTGSGFSLSHLQEENTKLQIEVKDKLEKITIFSEELKKERSEKNEFIGKNKQLFIEKTSLSEKLENAVKNLKDSQEKIIKFETSKEQKEKDFEKKLQELEHARKTLEEEKLRIRKEDEEEKKKQMEERDRMWNEHEQKTILRLKEIAEKPDISFKYYENKELPPSFDGKLKPDFLIEFLDQYIIFDAKMSLSDDLSIYVNNQVKSTVKKIHESSNKQEIYPVIFFIVPTEAISSLKKLSYTEDNYSFYIITPESIESIFYAYKKITTYEFANQFSPQERENIINLIATLEHHISKQNTLNILMTLEGIKKMENMKGSLDKTIVEDIEMQKGKKRADSFKPSDLKRLIQNPEEQINEIKKLITPKTPHISKESLEEQSSLFE